jgi:hypothetical protein
MKDNKIRETFTFSSSGEGGRGTWKKTIGLKL